MSRLKSFDDEYRSLHGNILAGFDEAGRGPLCGPVVAAGVILPPSFDNSLIDDSKKLNDKKRRALFDIIKSQALFYHISIISPEEIDKINILEASRKGMYLALEAMITNEFVPDVILTDFMHLPTTLVQYDLAHGDASSLSIAAASILAKVTRDNILLELDKKYPEYGFAKHKGYPTKAHLAAIEKYGLIEGEYRLSYAPVRKILEAKCKKPE